MKLYKQVKNGEYFLWGSTAFLQTNDCSPETYKKYLSPDCKKITRSMPTRLWDGQYHAVNKEQIVTVVSREEALKAVKKTREMFK